MSFLFGFGMVFWLGLLLGPPNRYYISRSGKVSPSSTPRCELRQRHGLRGPPQGSAHAGLYLPVVKDGSSVYGLGFRYAGREWKAKKGKAN